MIAVIEKEGILPSTISYTKVATSFSLKMVIINPSSPSIPKMAVSFLLLAN